MSTCKYIHLSTDVPDVHSHKHIHVHAYIPDARTMYMCAHVCMHEHALPRRIRHQLWRLQNAGCWAWQKSRAAVPKTCTYDIMLFLWWTTICMDGRSLWWQNCIASWCVEGAYEMRQHHMPWLTIVLGHKSCRIDFLLQMIALCACHDSDVVRKTVADVHVSWRVIRTPNRANLHVYHCLRGI